MATEYQTRVGQPLTDLRQPDSVSVAFAVVRGLRRHPLVIVGSLAAVALLAMLTIGGLSFVRGPGGADAEVLGAQVTKGAPNMAVQSMEAMKSLNAQAFWTALDEQMKTSLAAQGIDGPEGVERMFSQIRTSGHAIKSFEFIAKYDGRGETVSFFMAKRQGPQGGEVEVPFLVTTNTRGLVTRLD